MESIANNIDNHGHKQAIRYLTIDEEARFLNMVPEDVKHYVMFEASINWCAKAVYQLYNLHMERNGPATIAELRQQERNDLDLLLDRQYKMAPN